jgi:transcriptional regulator with XRE-family HTH domain
VDESAQAHLTDLIGRTIAARRKYLRLTMRDIKTRAGIDIGTLSLYERGKVASVRLDILAKLAIVLEMPLEQLIEPFLTYVRESLGEEYKG